MSLSTFTRRKADWLWMLLLLVAVTLVWCGHYKRWKSRSWSTPILYSGDERTKSAFSGDAMWGMAAAKAMATGEVLPVLSKTPASLGAPFTGNWNDYPSTDEAINTWWAILAKVFGLFVGSNLVLLCAHLSAAASFYLICRYLRYDPAVSVATALLFALSRYAFWRGLPHITLTYYWHVPCALLVVWWCIRERSIDGDRAKLIICVAVAAVHGVQNPYYLGMFLQFLAGAALLSFWRCRNWRRALLPIALAAVSLASFASVNLDTVLYRITHGPNPAAVVRSYRDLELYGLRPIELVLPFSHVVFGIGAWTQATYFGQTSLLGEAGSPYLGIVGIAALVILTIAGVRALGEKRFEVPVHFYGIVWVLAFSTVGGLNGVLGLAGVSFFRASNRYSIVILAAALLFLAKWLTARMRPWKQKSRLACCSALALVGIWDQLPPATTERDAATHKMLASDKKLVAQLEAQLPQRAMVFQLPVIDFPETQATAHLSEYEQFRPYLHSSQLHFSYGTNKGRYRDRWQKETEQLGATGFIQQLQRYGFSAVLINRRGYEDKAVSLSDSLRTAGAARVIAQTADFFCLALTPAQSPIRPSEFGDGWYDLEGDLASNRRWSSGNATLILHNPDSHERTAHLTFGVASFGRRTLLIRSGNDRLLETSLDPSEPIKSLDLSVRMRPGENKLRFLTNTAGKRPDNGDTRTLAFQITNFAMAP